MNPLVLLADEGATVVRLPVTADVQRQFVDLLEAQRVEFYPGTYTAVPFSGGYNADDDEILFIDGIQIPESIATAVVNPLTADTLEMPMPEGARIKSIFGGSGAGKRMRILFQAFDQRRLLSRNVFALLHSRNTFSRLETDVITFDHQLAAMIEDGRLYFRSFSMARRVLDLREYFREATNEDLSKFATQPCAAFEDSAAFVAQADTWIRRKVALIQSDAAVLLIPPTRIRAAARRLGFTVTVTKKDGKDAILFPAEKKRLKELLRFLDEDLYKGPLTDRMLVSNSKREYA